MIPPLDPEKKGGADLNEYVNILSLEVNRLSLFLRALEKPAHEPIGEPDHTPAPSPAVWSNAPKESADWEPVKGHEDWFRNPDGIIMSVSKGEVPQEILEKYQITTPTIPNTTYEKETD